MTVTMVYTGWTYCSKGSAPGKTGSRTWCHSASTIYTDTDGAVVSVLMRQDHHYKDCVPVVNHPSWCMILAAALSMMGAETDLSLLIPKLKLSLVWLLHGLLNTKTHPSVHIIVHQTSLASY